MTTPFQLTSWQKKQAAMLYHYASLDYLKGLQQRLDELMAFVDPTLDRATAQNRDAHLVSTRWGVRDTSQNWGNNAWPFLKTFQLDIAKDIANRAFEIYAITGAYHCSRGISEYSMRWTTPEEEEQFTTMFEAIYSYASKIDDTLEKGFGESRWSDFDFAMEWKQIQDQFSRLPKFQVRTDVEGENGKIPTRTGVYISQDDPNGALQFAWTGDGNGKLIECSTFNTLGLEALNTVGRDDLWLNDNKMLAFVMAHKRNRLIFHDSFFREPPKANIAPSVIALGGFTSRPCKWYFVEMLNDEYEDVDNRPIMLEFSMAMDNASVDSRSTHEEHVSSVGQIDIDKESGDRWSSHVASVIVITVLSLMIVAVAKIVAAWPLLSVLIGAPWALCTKYKDK